MRHSPTVLRPLRTMQIIKNFWIVGVVDLTALRSVTEIGIYN